MNRFILAPVLLVALLGMEATAQAVEWGPDFSAKMVLINPNNSSQSTSAEFISSQGRSRITSKIPQKRAAKQGLGSVQVDIINPYEGVIWRLFPQPNKFYEHRGKAVDELPPPLLPGDAKHACNTVADLKCENLGAETINGRATEKWQITAPTKDGEVTTTQWFDIELGIPIRELIPEKLMREMTEIKVGPQPAEQFLPPPGAEKIDPPKK